FDFHMFLSSFCLLFGFLLVGTLASPARACTAPQNSVTPMAKLRFVSRVVSAVSRERLRPKDHDRAGERRTTLCIPKPDPSLQKPDLAAHREAVPPLCIRPCRH